MVQAGPSPNREAGAQGERGVAEHRDAKLITLMEI